MMFLDKTFNEATRRDFEMLVAVSDMSHEDLLKSTVAIFTGDNLDYVEGYVSGALNYFVGICARDGEKTFFLELGSQGQEESERLAKYLGSLNSALRVLHDKPFAAVNPDKIDTIYNDRTKAVVLFKDTNTGFALNFSHRADWESRRMLNRLQQHKAKKTFMKRPGSTDMHGHSKIIRMPFRPA